MLIHAFQVFSHLLLLALCAATDLFTELPSRFAQQIGRFPLPSPLQKFALPPPPIASSKTRLPLRSLILFLRFPFPSNPSPLRHVGPQTRPIRPCINPSIHLSQ